MHQHNHDIYTYILSSFIKFHIMNFIRWYYICVFAFMQCIFIKWKGQHNFLSGQFNTNKFLSIKGYAYLLATSHPHKTLYDYFVLSYNIFYWIFSIHLEHANSSMPYSTLYTVDCQLLCSHELSMIWQYMKVYFRVE